MKMFRGNSNRRMTALALAAALAGATLASCAKDDPAAGAGDTTQVGGAPATIDTPRAASGDRDTVAALPPEAEVERQMKEKFDVMGGMDRVRIDVTGSSVTLEGTVASADRKQTAEDVARTVPGITEVTNRIEVAAK